MLLAHAPCSLIYKLCGYNFCGAYYIILILPWHKSKFAHKYYAAILGCPGYISLTLPWHKGKFAHMYNAVYHAGRLGAGCGANGSMNILYYTNNTISIAALKNV